MDYAAARQHMIDSQIRTNKVTDPEVIAALASVPREHFVADANRKLAYIDRPVPIGVGRRMMEPMVLARLLQVAQPHPRDAALVVGGGTGYSAAILSRLVKHVTVVECEAELVGRARSLLGGLGAKNVSMVEGPLGAGCAADAPFDMILLDGAVEVVPEALTGQLREGGRLATVMIERGVGHGILLVRADGVVSRRTIFDADAEALPGFGAPRGFVF